jgi:methionyl-tRNA formyltransferase
MMKTPARNSIRFAFFGSAELSVVALDELERAGLVPAFVVTTPDTKKGRGLKLSPSAVGAWAAKRGIEAIAPPKLDDAAAEALRLRDCEFFLVVAYGKLIPKYILDIPPKGVLNIHPSLLPRFRGASPVRSAILADEHTGISLMLLDEEMDHGPILAQKKIEPQEWPPRAAQFEQELIREGARLLADIIREWLRGDIAPQEQNHDIATYCGKIAKEDGLLNLKDEAYKNLLKIRAYEGWPGTYALFERGGKQLRVQILEAHTENGKLLVDTVKPEGKKEMPYAAFVRSGAKPASS